MLQREIVRFRASDVQPNPLEVDYWIDVTSNYYGGCIRYYRNDTDTWEMLDLNGTQADAIINYINKALDQIEQFINEAITEIRNELSEFKEELKEEVNKLWQYINQKVEELITQINNIRSEINDIKGDINNVKQDITNINNNINDINQDITNINSNIEDIRQDITNIDSKIDQQISDLRSYVNSEIIKAKNELKTYVDGKITNINNRITNLESSIDDIEQSITNINNKITDIENTLGNVGGLLDEQYIIDLINKLISQGKISVLDPVQQAMNKGTGVTLALPSANSGKISLPIWTGTEAEYNQLTKVAGMTYNIIDEESE